VKDFLKRVSKFLLTANLSRTRSIIVLLIIAAAIPLTVVMSQQQQETRQHASQPNENALYCDSSDPHWIYNWLQGRVMRYKDCGKSSICATDGYGGDENTTCKYSATGIGVNIYNNTNNQITSNYTFLRSKNGKNTIVAIRSSTIPPRVAGILSVETDLEGPDKSSKFLLRYDEPDPDKPPRTLSAPASDEPLELGREVLFNVYFEQIGPQPPEFTSCESGGGMCIPMSNCKPGYQKELSQQKCSVGLSCCYPKGVITTQAPQPPGGGGGDGGGSVTLRGKVTNSQTGTGIPNAIINQGQEIFQPENRECHIGTAETDGNGNFSFSTRADQAFCMRAPQITGFDGPDKSYECQIAGKKQDDLNCTMAGYGYGLDLASDESYNFSYSPKSSSLPISSPIPTATPVTTPSKGTINAEIFNDRNKNGMKDSGEPGINNIKISLVDGQSGSTYDEKQTDSAGKIRFTNLPYGIYQVVPTTPSGYDLAEGENWFKSVNVSSSIPTANVNFRLISKPTLPSTPTNTPTPTPTTAPRVNTLNINSSPVTGIKITSLNVHSGGYPGGITNYTKTSSSTIDARLDAPDTFVKDGITYHFSSASGCQIGRDADDTDNYCYVRVTGNTTQNVTFTYTR